MGFEAVFGENQRKMAKNSGEIVQKQKNFFATFTFIDDRKDYLEINYGVYLTEDELNNAVTTLESLCESV